MVDIASARKQIIAEVEARRQELADLSLQVHSCPELGLKEFKSSALLAERLGACGFAVEKGVAGLPTAFRAVYGSGKPAIAFLAEYDALPEIGHGCGHNIIAAAAVGAGIAARHAVDACGGSVVVFGTPAEESQGCKSTMVQKGAFAGVDAAMMVHPGAQDILDCGALAMMSLEVEYFGRAAHAASRPEEGINALEALVLAFNGVNSLRQHIRDTSRIHGIITHGGDAANIVPAYAGAYFLVRADDLGYLSLLQEKVTNCLSAAALATGARLQHRWGDIFYAPLHPNQVIAGLFAANMLALGRPMASNSGGVRPFSTDMGNVSQAIPSIHPIVAIAPPAVSWHTPEFAAAAVSPAGHRGLIDSAKALALTALDLLAHPENLARAAAEHQALGGRVEGR